MRSFIFVLCASYCTNYSPKSETARTRNTPNETLEERDLLRDLDIDGMIILNSDVNNYVTVFNCIEIGYNGELL
jgi:hypothetical protein